MNLLLTGAGGFVGGNIIFQADESVKIHGLEQRRISLRRENLLWYWIDLLEAEELRTLVRGLKPDVVVHTAAMSDIDFCEANPKVAEQINVGVTEVLVSLCAELDAKMIYFSSDSVFSGEKGGYTERDEPEPLNIYARTKVKAEKKVKENLDRWIVIRPSLILGLQVQDAGNSFLWRMIKSLTEGCTVAFPSEEVRSPLDVITLSRAILELCEIDYNGYLHLAGNDRLPRFEMAKRIAVRLGYDENRVIDRKPDIITGRALRPKDVSLDNSKAKIVLQTPMQSLTSGLDLVLANNEGVVR